jgi:mono/diheme cytochrome c family protein
VEQTRANRIVLLLVAALAAAACSSASHGNSAANSSPATAVANGQSIFQTGRDSDGSQIVAKPPALYPKCAACHRADGSGGVHLPGGAVSADLRYKALLTEQKPPYTLALLERAISTGIDNTGQPLNPVMPRWKLSKRDLHDVAYYVLTKLK